MTEHDEGFITDPDRHRITLVPVLNPSEIDADPRDVGAEAAAEIIKLIEQAERIEADAFVCARSSYMAHWLDRDPEGDPEELAEAWSESEARAKWRAGVRALALAKQAFAAAAERLDISS